MGTNFYLCPNRCAHCGRSDEKKHIGKSSAGWTFSLHVYPENNIGDLKDWIPLFEDQKNHIEDEYGREISVPEMLEVIRDRKWTRAGKRTPPSLYNSWEDFHQKNYSEPGPNDLVRFRVDNRYCIGHGEGTWDLIVGEFS